MLMIIAIMDVLYVFTIVYLPKGPIWVWILSNNHQQQLSLHKYLLQYYIKINSYLPCRT